MKLAACYTIFNGLELLEGAIQQIYDQVDFVVICWQEVSNKGHRSTEIIDYIENMASRNDSKVHIVRFAPDLSLNAKENERVKHQLMIDYCKKINCTHFFLSATDHYYHASDLIRAKLECAKHGYDVTATKMYTYYKHPTWQLDPPEDYYMPFICKLYPHTQISTKAYPVLVDPSVKVNTCERFHIFNFMMHHYSMVRKDIDSKLLNAAASVNWSPERVEQFKSQFTKCKPGDEITYFRGRRIIKVPDYFRILDTAIN